MFTNLSLKFDYLMSRMHREFGKTSTFQIIVIAILLHSFISILLIYAHLIYYNETYLSKHSSMHEHPNKGKIAIYSKKLTNDDIDSELRYKLSKIDYSDKTVFGPETVNLLSSKLIQTKELTHIGWFSDHFRWDEKIQCFNSRWTLCNKIFIAKCKQDTIRAIYQFVPFKSSTEIHNLYFSIRATAEQLIEQSNDGFYGLMALVDFNDGNNDLIRLKFQYESEAWSIRTLNYNSPKPITSVTLMVACFGYSGIASFTDIRLSSSKASIDPLHSTHQICSWCHLDTNFFPLESYANVPNMDIYEKLNFSFAHYSNVLTKKHFITFVTQVSMDRLTILERSLQTWLGPVSIAIFVPVKDLNQGIQDWQRLYVNKKISTLNISFSESTIVLVPSLETDNYPINKLRNLAIQNVKTRFMLLIDADFQASPNLENNFIERISKYNPDLLENQHSLSNSKLVFVVPVFEYLEMPNKDDPIFTNKDELIQLIHREDPMLQPFRFHESNEAHGLTNYWKWYYTGSPYNITINYHDKYEPYIIAEKTKDFPLFNEMLTNYGMNKVMHTTELFAANYKFQVLDNVWAIHFPHRSTTYYTDFLQNLELRLRNRAKRFHVLQNIIHRYRIKLKECDINLNVK